MQGHTPGPWTFVPSPAWGYSALWNPETRDEVLVPGGQNDEERPETWMGEELKDADRSLIEAAPDLLEALRDMVSDHACLSEATLAFARAAIAKATGTTEPSGEQTT